jgi:hypothetical protein
VEPPVGRETPQHKPHVLYLQVLSLLVMCLAFLPLLLLLAARLLLLSLLVLVVVAAGVVQLLLHGPAARLCGCCHDSLPSTSDATGVAAASWCLEQAASCPRIFPRRQSLAQTLSIRSS